MNKIIGSDAQSLKELKLWLLLGLEIQVQWAICDTDRWLNLNNKDWLRHLEEKDFPNNPRARIFRLKPDETSP